MENKHYEIILQSLTEDLLRRDAKIKDLERRYDELKKVHSADVKSYWDVVHQKDRQIKELQDGIDKITNEKKQLVDWKWKPKAGENYFFISSNLFVEHTSNDGFDLDKGNIRCGNCFRTSDEAEAMAEKIKKLLKGEAL